MKYFSKIVSFSFTLKLHIMRKIILLNFLLSFITYYSYSGVSVTHTNLTGYHCINGTITLSVSSICGGVYLGYQFLSNGTYTYTGLQAGTYNYTFVENCSIQTGTDINGNPTYTQYYNTQNASIIITEPPCATSITSFTKVQDVTGWRCQDGQISVSATATGCEGLPENLWWVLYKDGSFYNYSYYNYIIPGTPKIFTDLDTGTYYIVVYGGACSDTSSMVHISEPPCATSITSFTKVQDVTGWRCSNGQISVSATATSCNGLPENLSWTLYKNGSYYNYCYYCSYIVPGTPKIFTDLDTGSYYIVVYGGNCSDTSSTIHISEPPCNIGISISNISNPDNAACNNGNLVFIP